MRRRNPENKWERVLIDNMEHLMLVVARTLGDPAIIQIIRENFIGDTTELVKQMIEEGDWEPFNEKAVQDNLLRAFRSKEVRDLFENALREIADYIAY